MERKRPHEIFSGLVVDARGIGANPALAPRILTQAGQVVYSMAYVTSEERVGVRGNGSVAYVRDVESAMTHPRVAPSPMFVKAIGTEGTYHTDLVISDQEVQILHGIPEHFQILTRARVVVILDK